MTTRKHLPRLQTGVSNLDTLLDGGIPRGSVTVFAGAPGSGKTILTQQLCFKEVAAGGRVLYFNTLSEPTAKTLRYLAQFSFFDPGRLENGMQFVDLGVIARSQGLEESSKLVMERVRATRPTVVVIDSFKVFDDLARSGEELRKFGYEMAVNLMAWEATSLLLGEFGPEDIASNPLFSIVDGLVVLTQRERWGEPQRFAHIVKMRGTSHDRHQHPFVITPDGVQLFSPAATPDPIASPAAGVVERCATDISNLDTLLGGGVPRGSSVLVSGTAGTGKTVLLLEFIQRGADRGEKGILFSFEETPDRLLAAARGFGWDMESHIQAGRIQIVFIPPPQIAIEADLARIRESIATMGAQRVAIDSVSVFLHRIDDPEVFRQKTFELATIVKNSGAAAFFATDVPYGSRDISRFGVQETVVDGVIILSSTEERLQRQRYLEVYKLRNTAHLEGRHNLTIGPEGLSIYPRYGVEPAPPIVPHRPIARLASGVAGLDALLGGGLLDRSVTLVSGSAGIGKTTMGIQFAMAGGSADEPALYVALEERPDQIVSTASELGVPLREAQERGKVEIIYLSRDHVRANQLLTILTERILARGVRRLVLDGATHVLAESVGPGELRQLLYTLAARFKALGVTSVITLEAVNLRATGSITDGDFSPVADNILMLRYLDAAGELRPSLAVIKTRGTAHDRGTYELTIERGGMRIGPRVTGAGASA